MSVPIHCITVVLKKSILESTYPGGLKSFLHGHPDGPRDESLVGVPFMSSGDVQSFLDVLRSVGFDLQTGCAVGDTFIGELEGCEGISFERLGRGLGAVWQATCFRKGEV